jgi:hypothetical protein
MESANTNGEWYFDLYYAPFLSSPGIFAMASFARQLQELICSMEAIK